MRRDISTTTTLFSQDYLPLPHLCLLWEGWGASKSWFGKKEVDICSSSISLLLVLWDVSAHRMHIFWSVLGHDHQIFSCPTWAVTRWLSLPNYTVENQLIFWSPSTSTNSHLFLNLGGGKSWWGKDRLPQSPRPNMCLLVTYNDISCSMHYNNLCLLNSYYFSATIKSLSCSISFFLHTYIQYTSNYLLFLKLVTLLLELEYLWILQLTQARWNTKWRTRRELVHSE